MHKSLHLAQNDILNSILALHCGGKFECDASYGMGCFYKNIPAPELKFDITPMKEGVAMASSNKLPLADYSLNSLVFDPPFLTYVTGGRDHKNGKVAMSKRFGGYYSYDDLFQHYSTSIMEFYRVLKPGGILVFKCQDIIHNHRMHCTHHMILNQCEGLFRLKDLFILGAKHRMPGPQKGQQRHAHIWHSYFLVLERLKP